MTRLGFTNDSNPMVTLAPPHTQVFLVRNPATVSRVIAGETLVVPICAGIGDMEAVYTFNGLGGQLWHLLERSHAEEDLIAWVTQNYQVGSDVATADVQNFLGDLKEIGLVKQVGLPADQSENLVYG
jgi:Coenzyme PQQ synthesis protein D (PqqD)